MATAQAETLGDKNQGEKKSNIPMPIKTGFEHASEIFPGNPVAPEHNTVNVTTRLVVAVLDLAGQLGLPTHQKIEIADNPYKPRNHYFITAKDSMHPYLYNTRIMDMNIVSVGQHDYASIQADYSKPYRDKYQVYGYFSSCEDGYWGTLTALKRHYESPTPVAVKYGETWYGAFWDPFSGGILLKPITCEGDWQQYVQDFAKYRDVTSNVAKLISAREDLMH